MADRVRLFSHCVFRDAFIGLKVPKKKICFADDKLVSDDYTKDIGLAVALVALYFRSDLEYALDKNPDLVMGTPDFKSFVERCLETFVPKKNILDLTIGSCVIFTEFTMRKYNEDENFDLATAPVSWETFFKEKFLNEFNKIGGWNELQKKAKLAQTTTGEKYSLDNLVHVYTHLSGAVKFKEDFPQRQLMIGSFGSLEPNKEISQEIQQVSSIDQPGPSSAGLSTFPESEEVDAEARGISKMAKAILKRSTIPPSDVPEKVLRESPEKGETPETQKP